MDMTLGVMILLTDLWAITRTVRSDAPSKSKMLWVAGIVIFPIVGVIVWVWAGPS